MSNEISAERHGGGEKSRRASASPGVVNVGDTVIYTVRRNREYRFEVADVDEEWITFRTGQMVHKDRFVREDFEVLRSADESESSVIAADGGVTDTTER